MADSSEREAVFVLLVSLFEAHSAATLTSPDGQEYICKEFGWKLSDYDRLSRQPDFSGLFQNLFQIRLRVDRTAASYPKDLDTQYHKAKALLKKYRKQNAKADLENARRFVLAALAPAWGKPLQDGFAEVAALFGTISGLFPFLYEQARWGDQHRLP